MIHLDEKKLKETTPQKPVPYMARSEEELEFSFPPGAAYHFTERTSS